MSDEMTGEQAVDHVLGRLNRIRFHLDVHTPLDDALVHDTLRDLTECLITLALHVPYRTPLAPTAKAPEWMKP